MKFPTIGNIATTSVVSIDINKTISDAIKMMFESVHRNIIVIDENVFRILTVNDILNIKIQNVDLNNSLKSLRLSTVSVAHKDKNILEIVDYLNCEIEYICVTNSDGSLHGLVSHTDVTSSIDPETLMDNFCLQDFLKLSRRAKWVNKEMKTLDLLEEMIKNRYESVMIVENFKPIGIFTTKDVVKIIKHNEDLELPVSNYMSSPVDTISKNCSIKEALAFLKEKHYKRVVVVDDNGDMSGIITQKELISLSYSRWAMLMKEHHDELCQINASLLNKSKKYEAMASTDPLTGLYNRNKFLELYLSSYKTMAERDNSMSLIIIDIDYFKKINDAYGHNVGDEVLVKISQELQKTLRNIDIVCRWGGEEFVILLPATDIDNALFLAEKLRVHIEELNIDKIGRVTASFGVTRVVKDDDLRSIIERADKALYEAKASGRNCVKASF
ncbi:MAG: diguanylate cyclase [Sulfurimonas sp.]|uniref:diguanylate cyclase n=1 Tax=Sulfurimonas sp. TaxID=2022749 RepID=UPI00261CD0C9|nr:diguanylate cyclase [Sulfurimonas sp.]MDD5373402.1 diguanylate cyclase [Sulfurimonas sp.]